MSTAADAGADANAFVAALPPEARALAAPSAIPTRYAEAAAEARGEWPGVLVPAGDLAAFVVDRLPSELPLADALAALRVVDLYIACACTRGDSNAIASFEARFFSEVANAAKRIGSGALQLDDLRQLVRERLFVATGERAPRISEYRGNGSLRAWVRVTASRIALNAATRGPREVPREADALAEIAASDESSELAIVKTKYRVEFRSAVVAALSALDPADKAILVQAHAEGLSIDRIGAIYGIHRATAARRLERARASFVAATKDALATRLGGASAAEVDSIIGLIRSRFDLTLGGFLRGDG